MTLQNFMINLDCFWDKQKREALKGIVPKQYITVET